MTIDPRQLLCDMFEAAVGAALPEKCLAPHLPPPACRAASLSSARARPRGAMAKAVEDHWAGPLEGLVVTRYGHGAPCQRIEVVEASHPVPDAAGQEAAKRILAMVKGLTPEDLVLCLISGGGSALLALPADGVTLEDKQGINKALFKSGATISEMNCVRRHLSAIKGGRLAAAAAPARVVTLMISDVPGDDPCVIASGPTVADPTTSAEALAILQKYAIAVPANVRAHLESPAAETLKPGDPRLAGVDNVMIATPQMSLEAAAGVARKAGVAPLILANAIEGEARDVALVHAAIARQVHAYRHSPRPRLASSFRAARPRSPCAGPGSAAATPNFCSRLASPWMAIQAFMRLPRIPTELTARKTTLARCFCPIALRARRNRAYRLKLCSPTTTPTVSFAAIGDLVVTGPTLTNVNDFRAILVLG